MATLGRRVLAVALVAAPLLVACSAGDGTARGATPSASSATSASPAPVVPTTALVAPVQTLAPPTAPAPTTAGALTETVFPTLDGWAPQAGTGDDGRYLPNGTWVHEVPPEEGATDLMAQRCDALPQGFPGPRAVLAASYVGAGGKPGVAQAVEFATAQDAAGFLELYRRGVASCTGPDGPFVATDVRTTEGLVDRRAFADGNGDWVEVVHQEGARLLFVLLSDGDGQYAGDALDALEGAVTR